VLDAVRVQDGRQVLLKLWNNDWLDRPELEALRHFSQASRVNHRSNHVVPLLDVLTVAGWKDSFDGILVEPLLRDWDEPPFVMVAEGLAFILQLLEGLEFLHANNVAHGDIHSGNIMMDPAPIFPDGFHGAFNLNRGMRRSERHLKGLTRIQASVKYFYIDFDSSSMFPSIEERRLVVPRAAVWYPPEWFADRTAPLDPFKADVHSLDLTIIEQIRYRPGLHFVLPLFEMVIDDNPDNRPTAAALKPNFVKFLSTVKPSTMRGRIGWMTMGRRRVNRSHSGEDCVTLRCTLDHYGTLIDTGFPRSSFL